MSKLKRLVSTLCIFVLLWAAVMTDFSTFTVYAAATSQTIPFTDNCNYALGTGATLKWEKVLNSGTITVVRKDPSDNDPSNNCIALGGLKNSSTSPNPYLNANFTNGLASAKTAYEFSIKMNTNAASKSLALQLRDSAGANGWSFVAFAAGGITGVSGPSIMTYDVNQWYKVQAFFDFTVLPYKYKLYVTDQEGNTEYKEYDVPAAFTSVSSVNNRISFYDGGAYDSAEVDAFIDDVNVYRAPDDITITTPVIERVIASDNIVDITDTGLAAGTIRGRVNISNRTGVIRPVTVAIALYEGKMLKDIKYTSVNLAMTDVVLQPYLDIASVNSNNSVKVFIWSSFNDMKPLKNYKELLPTS